MEGTGHPVAVEQFQAEINGTQTDFVLAAYEDQIMVTVSQLDTFGTMLQAK
jgi:hypothetical protein